ncbi:uncharacterized protein N0V89_008064 [Didymosphaeria variabile]|uniref:Uncharacterized protein n=1 Tax=Didymosphaeria variabile TaxID=1932322 RepID=A0A9W8XF18_9PLEO|nr:uncharacterized protein N0V89_008064 [Didymosphaeria variabile]KAJ4349449.1 hypothetical protein N0V89_008064 [Didymosphaeria variabile]
MRVSIITLAALMTAAYALPSLAPNVDSLAIREEAMGDNAASANVDATDAHKKPEDKKKHHHHHGAHKHHDKPKHDGKKDHKDDKKDEKKDTHYLAARTAEPEDAHMPKDGKDDKDGKKKEHHHHHHHKGKKHGKDGKKDGKMDGKKDEGKMDKGKKADDKDDKSWN